MPWCPQCGAEYREGVEACAKCGVGLVGERPTSAAPPPTTPAVVRKVWADAKRAWGYLAGAARLLRRNPSLLLLPLAVVLFNGVEGTVGGYIMVTRTAYGRAVEERAHKRPVPQPTSRAFAGLVGSDRTTPEIPSVALLGTWRVAAAALAGGANLGEEVTFRTEALAWLLGLLAGCLVLGPLNALLRGGYYGVAARAMASGKANWRQFGPQARRFFVRFWGLYAVLVIVVCALFWAADFPWRDPAVTGVALLAYTWSCGVAAFLLALAAFIIVTDDCGVLTSIRRSVATVIRDIVVAFLLAAGIGLVEWGVTHGFGWLGAWVHPVWETTPGSGAAEGAACLTVALFLGLVLALAALSALSVLAALMWYREVRQRWWPATARIADERG